jgi:hypothetical protein
LFLGLAKTYKIIILALNRTEANCASDISFVVIRFPIMHYKILTVDRNDKFISEIIGTLV